MAFNFNWSPLIADTSRARDMLTAALNKSPKPPIIVDDILVTELNLGSVPPELEILEIGDLAEDRFRGIFKMVYSGDAFLTLKTRVQANPLNTYLSTKPSFASPQPLAASSGLTIPLQITLSDIKLSGFVILVFSRQKGLTLVFRNDPLESLKVSSTFDSIPFVRDYLQKEIEGQLRVLFMEDLPAILHRLSLRLWSPDYSELDDDAMVDSTKSTESATVPIDPLASPPQNPIDPFNNPLDDTQPSYFLLDPPSENHASFSQKNLLRLAALTDSHRTLSLFTPPIRDAVFRASAGAFDRGDYSGTHTPVTLSRVHSSIGSTTSSVYSFSDSTESVSSRPSLVSYGSSYTGLSMGAGRPRTHAGRKKKTRVVNLRKKKEEDDIASVATETTTSASSLAAPEASEEREDELVTPPRSPNNKVRFRSRLASIVPEETLPAHLRPTPSGNTPKQSRLDEDFELDALPAYQSSPHARSTARAKEKQPSPPPAARQSLHRNQISHPHSAHRPSPSIPLLRTYSLDKLAPHATSPMPYQQSPYQPFESSGGILEQAWMMKMANEIARKVREEKAREAFRSSPPDVGPSSSGRYVGNDRTWGDDKGREEAPPPAYGL